MQTYNLVALEVYPALQVLGTWLGSHLMTHLEQFLCCRQHDKDASARVLCCYHKLPDDL